MERADRVRDHTPWAVRSGAYGVDIVDARGEIVAYGYDDCGTVLIERDVAEHIVKCVNGAARGEDGGDRSCGRWTLTDMHGFVLWESEPFRLSDIGGSYTLSVEFPLGSRIALPQTQTEAI